MALIRAGVIQEIAQSNSPSSADHLAKASGADRLLIGIREAELKSAFELLTY